MTCQALGVFPYRENGDKERPGIGGTELESKVTMVMAGLAHPGFGTLSALTSLLQPTGTFVKYYCVCEVPAH